MRSFAYLFPIVLVVALGGCQTNRDYSNERLNDAEAMLVSGNERGALDILNTFTYDVSSYGDRARAVITKTPGLKDRYASFLRTKIAESSSVPTLESGLRDAKKARSYNLISPEQENELMTLADQKASEGNRSNTLLFDYSDDIANFPSLAAPDAQMTIFRRSLNKLESMTYPQSKMIKAVFDKAAASGPKSPEYSMVQAALPTLRLSSDEVKTFVAPVFPDQARKLLAERYVTVRLFVEPEDRLLNEDLASRVRNMSSNVTLVTGSEQPTLEVRVKKLQWDERREPERTQPVVYSQGDVNLLAAVMLMPRNASYIYDVTTGGAELAYAFEIKASGKTVPPFDKLLREKSSRSWRACSNARIQNVFGGIQRADFIANDHMNQTCNGGGSPVSSDGLRNAALDDVVRTIRSIPAIDRAAMLR